MMLARPWRAARTMAWCLAMTALAGGCGGNDERLARLAERHAQAQREQNERLARQSELVVQESTRVAEAAQALAEKDAQARQELIAAQRQLQHDLHAERSGIDRQREDMERERRQLAQQRHRDPILAAAIHTVGMLIACLAPLVLAAYALRQLGRVSSGNEELGDLLLSELTAERPLLLPVGRRLALPEPGDKAGGPPDPAAAHDAPS